MHRINLNQGDQPSIQKASNYAAATGRSRSFSQPPQVPIATTARPPEEWRPVGLPELRQFGKLEGPPPPYKRVALGYDMRTLRKQVEELQAEVEKRLDYQERLYSQNHDLWNQLNILAENNEANSEAAKLFLNKLIGEIKKLEADRAQYQKKVMEAEKLSDSLVTVAREKKALEDRAKDATEALHSIEESLKTCNTENRALQEKLSSQVAETEKIEAELQEAAFRKQEAELEARVQEMGEWGPRGLRHAWWLLSSACWRQRRMGQIASRFNTACSWVAAEEVFFQWMRFSEVGRMFQRGRFNRDVDRVCETFLRWKLFAARSSRAGALAYRVSLSRYFDRWGIYYRSKTARKEVNQHIMALQKRWFARRHLRAWHATCCFISGWNAEDIREKLRIAVYYHLWKVFCSWRGWIQAHKRHRSKLLLDYSFQSLWRLAHHIFKQWWHVVLAEKYRRDILGFRGLQSFQWHANVQKKQKILENMAIYFWMTQTVQRVFQRLAFFARNSQTYAATRRRVMGNTVESSLELAQAHWMKTKLWVALTVWQQKVEIKLLHSKQMKRANRHFWRQRGRQGLKALNEAYSIEKAKKYRQRRERLSKAFQGLVWHTSLIQQTRGGAVGMVIALRRLLLKRKAKCFKTWQGFMLSRRRVALLEVLLIEQKRRKILRLCWSNWLLAWMRAGREKAERIGEQVANLRGKISREESRQHKKEVGKKKLAEAVQELAREMEFLQEQKRERDMEVARLQSDIQKAALNEASLREEVETKERELKVLDAEYSRVSRIESNQLEDQVRVEAQKAQSRHQERELMQAMRGVEAQLQTDVANAEELAQKAIKELEIVREQDDRALEDAMKISKKYKDALRQKEALIKDMEKEYVQLQQQLRSAHEECKAAVNQHERGSEEQENQIRKAESQRAVLQLKLSQVEARAREAEGMAREREREAATLREEIRRMRAERQVLENIHSKEKTSSPSGLMGTQFSSSFQSMERDDDDNSETSHMSTSHAARIIGSLQQHLKQNDGSKAVQDSSDHGDAPAAIPYSTLQQSIEELQQRILNRLNTSDDL